MPGEWRAVVTGAGSGVGREIALQLASQKWSLALADNNYDALLDTQSRCAAMTTVARATQVDVANRAEINSWAESSRRALGGLDAIFNVAGVLYRGDVIDTPTADFDLVMATNFESVVNSSRAFPSRHPEFTSRSNRQRVVCIWGYVRTRLLGVQLVEICRTRFHRGPQPRAAARITNCACDVRYPWWTQNADRTDGTGGTRR